jgi:hypothetical protein
MGVDKRRIRAGFGFIVTLLVMAFVSAVPAVRAHDVGHGRRFGVVHGTHQGLHIQDRVGRAFGSHFMLGSRFTAGDDDAVNAHLHTTRTGRVFWHSVVPGQSRFPVRHRRPIAVVAPPTVVVTTPFFCDPCAVAFASAALFESHLHRMHGVPADALDGRLTDIDGRLVFVGE